MFTMSLLTPAFSQTQQQEKKETIETVDETNTPQMSIVDNRLIVKNAPVGKKIEIFTILGNKVKEFEIKTSEGEFDLNLRKAIYIFKMDGTVRKFVIK